MFHKFLKALLIKVNELKRHPSNRKSNYCNTPYGDFDLICDEGFTQTLCLISVFAFKTAFLWSMVIEQRSLTGWKCSYGSKGVRFHCLGVQICSCLCPFMAHAYHVLNSRQIFCFLSWLVFFFVLFCFFCCCCFFLKKLNARLRFYRLRDS